MQVLKRIFFAVVFAVGILFRLPALAEDQNNFEVKFTFTASVSRANQSTTYFKISAQGTFFVDWGDGNKQTITRTNTTQASYSHTYTSTGTKTIKLGGLATGYSTASEEANAAISFADITVLTGISGSIGRIFPTLANGSQPLFRATFAECTNLAGSIPPELFQDVYGTPREHMFRSLFYKDTKLTGSIPGELFSSIRGNQKTSLFQGTFYNCSGLSSFIPPELFAGINKTPTVSSAFSNVFNGSGLVTSCPSGYKKYTTGFESSFSSKVSCEPNVTCSSGYARYGSTCYRICSFGSKFMVSTGLSYDVFGELEPSGNPSIHIKLGNQECYVFSKPGASNGFNFKHTDGQTYHLVGAN